VIPAEVQRIQLLAFAQDPRLEKVSTILFEGTMPTIDVGALAPLKNLQTVKFMADGWEDSVAVERNGSVFFPSHFEGDGVQSVLDYLLGEQDGYVSTLEAFGFDPLVCLFFDEAVMKISDGIYLKSAVFGEAFAEFPDAGIWLSGDKMLKIEKTGEYLSLDWYDRVSTEHVLRCRLYRDGHVETFEAHTPV
jgi:hypothetical protein